MIASVSSCHFDLYGALSQLIMVITWILEGVAPLYLMTHLIWQLHNLNDGSLDFVNALGCKAFIN